MTRYAHDVVVPSGDSDLAKKQQVEGMFDTIAGRYDLMNRLLSAGIDIRWRKKLIHVLSDVNPGHFLDVATGTGDVAIMTCQMLKPQKVTGIDISEGMLELGRKKIAKLLLNKQIQLVRGDSEAINWGAASFDAVTVAFGVRNFENLEKGLLEIHRVLKPGGKLAILEFSRPRAPFRWFYDFYMSNLVPAISKLFSKNRSAYKYLHSSVKAFPEGKTFLHILEKTGFKETSLKRLSLGICTIYCGRKGSG